MSATLPDLDPRVYAFDPVARLAEEALRAALLEDDWRFVTPRPARAGKARVSLRARPDPDAAQVTEALPGEALELLTEAGGWAWVRTAHDRYPGWARADALVAADGLGNGGAEDSGTLRVTALRAHAFAGPKVSRAIRAELCAGARLTRAPGEEVTEDGRRWVPVRLPGGEAAWVQAVTLSPAPVLDAATYALRLLETPYVWGGRSAWGLDCSGLTQLAYAALGRGLPRDADQQQAFLTPVADPRRGDLAFFPGHVGLMLDGRQMVHANATHMRVTVETLGEGEYGARLEQGLTGFGRWTL